MPKRTAIERPTDQGRSTSEKRRGHRSSDTRLRSMGEVALTFTITANRINFLNFADGDNEFTRSSAGKAWLALVDGFVRALREDEREATPVKFRRYPDPKKEAWLPDTHALVGDLDVGSLADFVKRIDEASDEGANPRAIRAMAGRRVGSQTLKLWREFAQGAVEAAQTELAA